MPFTPHLRQPPKPSTDPIGVLTADSHRLPLTGGALALIQSMLKLILSTYKPRVEGAVGVSSAPLMAFEGAYEEILRNVRFSLRPVALHSDYGFSPFG